VKSTPRVGRIERHDDPRLVGDRLVFARPSDLEAVDGRERDDARNQDVLDEGRTRVPSFGDRGPFSRSSIVHGAITHS
jgi:hypothetical protein